MAIVSPSILSADFGKLGADCRTVLDAGAQMLHYDVMDGHFVPNISFGPSLLKAIHKEFDLHCDVHLMISDPLKYVESFATSGAGTITIHQEANDFLPCLRKLRELGVRVGASVKPGTSVETLREALPLLDRVLLMTVEPGFGGQKLMPDVLPKAAQLRAMGFTGDIEADGGINGDNAPQLAQVGIDTLVMGTAFFRAEEPEALVRRVHSL